uniref:Uncharacterized protein n=1 Tax=Rhizophora mucronata TaxID=61149 RepID=A0A2P2PA67_RHIMU
MSFYSLFCLERVSAAFRCTKTVKLS